MREALADVKATVVAYMPQLVFAIFVFVLGWILAKAITGILSKILQKRDFDKTVSGFICNLSYMILMTFVVISTLSELGIESNSFVAVLGAAGLAVGFALQDSLSNFASGVLLIVFKPFKAGDFIEGAGTMGSVEEVQVFCTFLKTPDNKVVVIPNSALTGGNIINYSKESKRRVDMVFGIGYGDDIQKAKTIMESVVTQHPKVLSDPALTIAVSELADSSVNFVVRPWCKTEDYWDVSFDLHEQIKLAFDKEGISIPFPQQDVHLFKQN